MSRTFSGSLLRSPVFIRACAMTCASLAVLVGAGAGISPAVAQHLTDQQIREDITRSVREMRAAIKNCAYDWWKSAKRDYDEDVENVGRLKISPPEAPTYPIPCNPVTTNIRTQQEPYKPLVPNRSLVPEEADRYLYPATSFLGLNLTAAVSWFDQRLAQRELLGAVVTNDFSDRSQGMGFGIGAGYLFQTGIPNILVGASASLDVLNLDTIRTFPGGFFLGQNTGVIGSLKAQIGVVATPSVMFYGEVGPAFINIDHKLNFSGRLTSVNRTAPGVDFGAGIAFQPANWQVAGIPVGVFTQINYIILRAETYDNPGSPLFRYRNDTEITHVKIGVRIPISAGSRIKQAEQRGAR